MVSFNSLVSTLAAAATFSAGLVKAAEEWGSFSGEVTNIDYIFAKDYSLISELVITLNPGWSLADLEGKTAGQITNKTIAFNTADSKYYAKIGYTATSVNNTEDAVCFEPVPIRIALNEEKDGAKQGRLVDGYFFVGCVPISKIANLPASSASADASSSAPATVSTTSLASTIIQTISSATDAHSSGDAHSSEAHSTDAPVSTETVTSSVAPSAIASTTSLPAFSTVSTSAPHSTVVVVGPSVNGTGNGTANGGGHPLEQSNDAASSSIISLLTVGAVAFAFALSA